MKVTIKLNGMDKPIVLSGEQAEAFQARYKTWIEEPTKIGLFEYSDGTSIKQLRLDAITLLEVEAEPDESFRPPKQTPRLPYKATRRGSR